MCLLSLITTVAASLLLLYIGISGTAVFPDTATLLARKSADGKSLGFVEPLNLASFNGFNVDIPSNSNIHNRFRFHISGRLIRLQGLTSITWHLVWSDALISHELSNCISLVSDTARCFSCMSRLYEAVWPALSSIYKRPKNFTDLCNDNDLDPQHVPFTYCPTICIRMWEEPTVAGVRIRGHIRGCLDELLYNGFNQTIVTWYRWMHRDSCRQYRKRELFKLPTELSDDSYITVCTCYADYCNGRSSAGRTGSGVSHCPLLFVLLCSLTILFLIQRISLSSF